MQYHWVRFSPTIGPLNPVILSHDEMQDTQALRPQDKFFPIARDSRQFVIDALIARGLSEERALAILAELGIKEEL